MNIRKLRSSDCYEINAAFLEQGWDKSIKQYQHYFELQNEGKRDILLAEKEGEFAGYLTIKWESDYRPFKEKNIPEIVDFNVLMKYQRKGIGTALMDEAERRIKRVSKFAGIGFGVYKDYGAAQILYIKRRYVPDGNGLVINSVPVKYGDEIKIDDGVVFCLIKEL